MNLFWAETDVHKQALRRLDHLSGAHSSHMSVSLVFSLIVVALLVIATWGARGLWDDMKTTAASLKQAQAQIEQSKDRIEFLEGDNADLRRVSSNLGNTVGELLGDLEQVKASVNLKQNSKVVVDTFDDVSAELAAAKTKLVNAALHVEETNRRIYELNRDLEGLTSLVQKFRNGSQRKPAKDVKDGRAK